MVDEIRVECVDLVVTAVEKYSGNYEVVAQIACVCNVYLLVVSTYARACP